MVLQKIKHFQHIPLAEIKYPRCTCTLESNVSIDILSIKETNKLLNK